MQATVQKGNWQKQWGMLVAEVWADEDLKRRLIADPASVLQEYGIEVPQGVELNVVEDTDQVRHLILPPSPSDDLSDEDLTASPSMYCWLCGGCGGCGCGSRRCGCGVNS
ncbi:MAG TPA: NHLP leader peptide family RiPP precursor [Planctomycetaceae bacterium]